MFERDFCPRHAKARPKAASGVNNPQTKTNLLRYQIT